MEDDSGQREAQDRLTARTWRAWRTVKQMVADRGYELAEDEVNISFERFKLNFTDSEGTVKRSNMSFSAKPGEELIRRVSDVSKVGTVYVEFLDESSFGTEQMRKFGKFCSENHHRVGIIVSHVAVSSAAKKEVAKWKEWTDIEWFLEDDLLINITHHDLVPRHIVLSREEKLALLKRYRLKETQLPRILMRDPVAKYYGMQRGQVVKIIRKSETAGRYASYRLCV
ncbi:RNA polymerase Rpb5, C-terminal domain-containing protein [Pestalotiopsis sp. NC0098]|nr:RNA polymerase Rpb5, C-terminal domain-containing protein [Pestalotiopsis sp. NC0098]